MSEQDRSAEDAPRFRLLTEEKLHRIHEASLEVLEEVSVRIATEEARTLLTDAGCDVADDEIVKIPRQVVEDAIESAPKRIVIYDRDGNEALFLDSENTYFGMGLTCLQFCDLMSGARRNALDEDVGLACRVGDALPNVDFAATPLVTKATLEVPQDVVNQHEFQATSSTTTLSPGSASGGRSYAGGSLVYLVGSTADMELDHAPG